MSGTTSVPTIAFTDRGFVAPSEEAIIDGLNADYNAAFGGNLNTSPSTPTGQLIASTGAMLGDTYDNEMLLFNSVDPSYAFGRMQDAVARIYFLERDAAQATILQVACVGQGSVPSGMLIQDDSQIIYYCTADADIPPSGTITLSFAAQTLGPIPIPSSVSIYQIVPGLDTITLVSGEVGVLAESRSAFEQRRAATIAANAAGFLPAISGAVGTVPGVTDWYATENFTGSSMTTGGVSLTANSLYVCVAGGTNADVARAIWTKKNPGCAYTGNTTVVVQDTNSGYSPPYPSYNVTFERPDTVQIAFTVTIADGPQVPASATEQINAAILVGFLGEDSGSRARIGSTLYASRYYGPIYALGPWVQIISLTIGATSFPTVAFTASIAATLMTVTAVANATFTATGSGTTLNVSAVTGTIRPGYALSGTGVPAGTTIVAQLTGTPGGAGHYQTSNPTTSSADALTAVGLLAIGDIVFGTNVAAGTVIISFASGSGNTGTYNVSINQTVTSESMIATTALSNDIVMAINQLPTFAIGNANVVLI